MVYITIADKRAHTDEEIAVDAEDALEAVDRAADDNDEVYISATVKNGLALMGDGFHDSDVFLAIDHAGILTDVETIREAATEALEPTLSDLYREEIESQRPSGRTNRSTYDERDESTLAIEPSSVTAYWGGWEVEAIQDSPNWRIVGVEAAEYGPRLVLERLQGPQTHEELLEWIHERYGEGSAHISNSHPDGQGVYAASNVDELPAGWEPDPNASVGTGYIVRQ